MVASIGIIGATIMPHNLYLHSGLVRRRAAELRQWAPTEALRFLSLDSWVMLSLACIANAVIIVVAAVGFRHASVSIAGLEQAYHILDPAFGAAGAGIVFAIGLLAAGQSAATTAGLAGQIIMEGFFDLRVPVWLRALITRAAELGPALLLPLAIGEGGADRLLVLSQVVLGLALPFVLVPMLFLLADRELMRRAPLRRDKLAIATGMAVLLIGLNLWLAAGNLA